MSSYNVITKSDLWSCTASALQASPTKIDVMKLSIKIMPAPTRFRQQGIYLTGILLILALSLSAFMLQHSDLSNAILQRDKKTMAALFEAKSVLIGRAMLDNNRPGSLPCPDSNDDGSADMFYGNKCPASIGRFPWRTLGIPPLEDGNGEKLWYRLSENYRDHPVASPINAATPGLLSVDDHQDVVAVIFSAGLPLSFQTGRPSHLVKDYLEQENADGDTVFSSAIHSLQNDRLITVNRTELMQQVSKRVLAETAKALKNFYSKPSYAFFPYAAKTSQGRCDGLQLTNGFLMMTGSVDAGLGTECTEITLPAFPLWLKENAWHEHIRYELARACTQVTPGCSGTEFIIDGTYQDVRLRLSIPVIGQKIILR